MFIELDDGAPLQVGLIIKLSENPAKLAVKLARPNEMAEFQKKIDYVHTDQ